MQMVSKLKLPQLQSCSSHRAEFLRLGQESQLSSAQLTFHKYCTHTIFPAICLTGGRAHFLTFWLTAEGGRSTSAILPACLPASEPREASLLQADTICPTRTLTDPHQARWCPICRGLRVAPCGPKGLTKQGPT